MASKDWLQDIPADIVAVVLLVGLTNVSVLVPIVRKTPLDIFCGFLFCFFVPGYILISILFPETNELSTERDKHVSDSDTDTESAPWEVSWSTGTIDWTERFVLSVISSVAVVLLIGLALSYTPWGFRTVPVLVAMSVFILLCSRLAVSRRLEVIPERRFRVPYDEWFSTSESELLSPDTKVDIALNIVIICSLLVAVGSMGYALSVSNSGEQFTEFYLLDENNDGQRVADNYPQNFTQNEGKSLYVGVGNYQGTSTNYTIVVKIQRTNVSDGSLTVLEEREVDRFSTTVEPNETRIYNRTLAPTLVGSRLRLVFLLFRGAPPADPGTDNAYRELHLWVSVSDPQ